MPDIEFVTPNVTATCPAPCALGRQAVAASEDGRDSQYAAAFTKSQREVVGARLAVLFDRVQKKGGATKRSRRPCMLRAAA